MRLCLISLLLAALVPPAQGQAKKDTVYAVGEVVVTATRKAGSVIEVPLAITVVDQKDIQRVRGYGLDDILSGIPGVLAQSRYGSEDVRLTIRGFGARGAGARSNAGTTRGLRVMIDGIPETEPDGRTSFDLVDLAAAGRIEVIRSNATSLWGNAAGGVINVFSNTAFDAPYASVMTSFGSFGYARENVQAGTLLGQGRFFFSLSRTTFDGWRVHSGSFSTVVNTGIESPLGERTRLGVYLLAGENSFRIPGPLTPSQYDANPQQAQDDPAAYSPTFVQRDERRHNRLGRIGVTLAHDFDDANGLSFMAFAAPKYLQRSERNTYRDFTRYHVGGNAVYRNTTRFAPDIVNTLQVGVDEAFQDGAILFYSLLNRERGTLQTDKNEAAGNTGVFLQNETIFSDRVSLILGGRFDAVQYTYQINYDSDPAAKLLNDQKVFSHFTPKAALTYRFSPSHSVYASLGGGVEVPAGNETDPAGTFGLDTLHVINPLLDASTSTTVELGTKQILPLDTGLLRMLSYDVALYLVNVKNDIIPYRGGRFYFTAGETRRIGIEAGVTARFDEGISLLGALTLSGNRFKNYVIDSAYYGKPGKTVDLADNKVPGVPSLFYSLKARYSPLWARGVFIEAGVSGVGEYFADDYNQFLVPSYSILSASVGFDEVPLAGDRLTLRGFIGIQNIGDTHYAASAWVNPDLSTAREPVYLEPGLPRNFTGSLALSYKL